EISARIAEVDGMWNGFFSRRGLLISVGVAACLYGITVLVYVQRIPDIGLTTAFSAAVQGPPHTYAGPRPEVGDVVKRIGETHIRTWADVLHAPFHLRGQLNEKDTLPDWAKAVTINGEQATVVRVQFRSAATQADYESWCVLGRLPLEEMVPSVAWFFLMLSLFLVGTLVLWKRPTDDAAIHFFLLCVVTLGAFMGGYHWARIATQPILLLVFMICAVLLPVASLHFYLLFPRKKHWLTTRPRWNLALIYGPPLAFLAALLILYLRVRGLVQEASLDSDVDAVQAQALLASTLDTFELVRKTVYVYLGVAAVYYLGCVFALVDSFRAAADSMERNQVKWILYGAVASLFPIAYSWYLAVWRPDMFAAGGATWPMFAASACLTLAFAVSITRYRMMELDKIISSGMGYFLISFLAGLMYYGVVFVGTLIFNQVIASPPWFEAIAVSTTALLLMLVLDLARARIKKILDRRFSRDKSQLDRTLQRMGQAIERLVDPVAHAQKLMQATSELLGVTRGAMYLRQGDPPLFRLAGSLGEPPELNELSLGCPLIEAAQQGQLIGARRRDEHGNAPAHRQLHFLGGEIAHPLLHEGRLLALLVLGPKGSPYRSEDFHLLAAFSQLTVLALEGAEGHRTIEQLNRELQTKVEKISEQQRRILLLQSQLRRQTDVEPSAVGDQETRAERMVPEAGGIFGSGPALQHLHGLVRKVAATDAVVLIRGESGVGKELVARAVHDQSGRADKPFVKVHCAALSANLLESELFGHVKGAFTGAHKDKVGRFELADGGTLFLDEIGDINLEVQTKLLRVLQEKTIERVGSSESLKVDVRILAATHQELEGLIRHGKFREDLFYRLNVFPIRVPPLRERREDIAELAVHFVRLAAERCKKDVRDIDDDVLSAFKDFSWPGNIRQLENVIERAVVIAEGNTVSLAEIPPDVLDGARDEDKTPVPPRLQEAALVSKPAFSSWRAERERQEREQLVRALASADGNKAEAARALGIARSTLVSRLKKLGLG
ncbi:MAG: sigma 54-interacting transcriptional regulator, partial [Gemmataceae bacterium]|nr:sigma 54-interacting transcriptional regulator [Gemmataceae bacterium]